MYNQKMKNIELLNSYHYVNFDAKEWASVVLGIRKSLNLSQTQLAINLGFSRYTPMRYENCLKIPRKNSIKRVLKFIDENNLNMEILKELGHSCVNGFVKDTKIPKLELEYSKELAELIGILLGDGEIMKDGTLRISFDPKKDLNFHYRRTFPLIENLLDNKLRFESYKRFAFYNIAFVRYLNQDCGLQSGNKSKNNSGVPKWCFEKQEYIVAVLRGLFDTDGYFAYADGSAEIMLGRFSHRCTNLVEGINKALKILGFNPSVEISNDGRFKIRLVNNVEIINFFSMIGSSNLKHITRFLLWRIANREAKIEIEGLDRLIKELNTLVNLNVEKINIPFLWNLNSKEFECYVRRDLREVKGAEIRNLYKWSEITKDLIRLAGNKKLAFEFGITERSVRKWREGIRNPSNKFILKLIKLTQDYNLKLENYKLKTENVNTNCRSPR